MPIFSLFHPLIPRLNSLCLPDSNLCFWPSLSFHRRTLRERERVRSRFGITNPLPNKLVFREKVNRESDGTVCHDNLIMPSSLWRQKRPIDSPITLIWLSFSFIQIVCHTQTLRQLSFNLHCSALKFIFIIMGNILGLFFLFSILGRILLIFYLFKL